MKRLRTILVYACPVAALLGGVAAGLFSAQAGGLSGWGIASWVLAWGAVLFTWVELYRAPKEPT